MRGTPFMYVFDGSTLVDGANYQRIPLTLDNDSAFLLRHVSGMNYIAGQWRMYDAEGRPSFDAMQQTSAISHNHAVVPEAEYPRGSQIQLDLGTVARLVSNPFSAVPRYPTAQAVFQGVKLSGSPTASELEPEPDDKFQVVLPYTWSFRLTLNWTQWLDWPAATIPSAAVNFMIPVQNHDFWLHGVTAVKAPWLLFPDGAFSIMLYGGDGYTPLMSAPVVQWHINGDYNIDLGAPPLPPRVSRFPYPGVFYRKGSEIRVAITSLVANDDADFPKIYDIYFHGLRRES